MDYRLYKGKYVIQKYGVYFALTPEQIPELLSILIEIQMDDMFPDSQKVKIIGTDIPKQK